jgi:hypothetical protein
MTFPTRTSLLRPAALLLSVLAIVAPASAETSAWRSAHHGRHEHSAPTGREGPATTYRLPDRGFNYEGPVYRGYGYNSNNWCYLGESMYDGC